MPPNRGLGSSSLTEVSRELRYYTKQPLWIVPFAGIAIALLSLFKFGRMLRLASDLELHPIFILLGLGGLGMAAAVPLVLASWVKSRAFSGLMLWGGILGVAIMISFTLMWFS